MNMQFLPGSIEIEGSPYELEIWELLRELLADQYGYCAYKIPILGTSHIDEVPTFVITTLRSGVLLIDVVSEKIESSSPDATHWLSDVDDMYSRDLVLEHYSDEVLSRFKRSTDLYNRKEREQLVPVRGCIVFRENDLEDLLARNIVDECEASILGSSDYQSSLRELVATEFWDGSEKQLDEILSLIEGTEIFGARESFRDSRKELATVNDFIQRSLRQTFKQDSAQRQISMQIPPGPQRVRGLAGTGKTVVLSLKAALTALRVPGYKILFLFNTQSLYNMIEKAIGDYYAKEAKSALDWTRIDVMHAWGGRSTRSGLYSSLCEKYRVKPLTLQDVRGRGNGLEAIYRDFLETVGEQLEPIYDLVLIDEAQDFPNVVFEVVYKITKEPKRIVWAYDDFQTLSGLRIREPDEMFGLDEHQRPNVASADLRGDYSGIPKDFILPNCYRNPRIVLMVAHGVALGIRSKDGIVDSVDNVQDWHALGYRVIEPENATTISAGDGVVVERPDEYSKNLLERLLNEQRKRSDKLLQLQTCESDQAQYDYVANTILRLVEREGVSPEEIFVVTLDTRGSEECLKSIRILLNSVGIDSIMPGFVEQASQFKETGKVTLATPFRAKGNEANVVFVINCQDVTTDRTFRKRNAFFVAVTRSRGWCYIVGTGQGMDELEEEIESIMTDLPKFRYTRPEDEVIRRRRLLLSQPSQKIDEQMRQLEQIKRENPELIRQMLLEDEQDQP